MRILMVGSGGVGDAVARIAVERDFFELLVVADHDEGRATRTVEAATARRPGDSRLVAARVRGVLGPEAFDAVPFLELLAAPRPQGYGSPWGTEERAAAPSAPSTASA